MNPTKKQYALAVVIAGIWMNVNEFIRNELILKQAWLDKYSELSASFPTAPINGAVWGLWAFIFVSVLIWLTARVNIIASVLVSWVLGYVLLWAALWNLNVLPDGILYWAVPWSLIEVFGAAYIARLIFNRKAQGAR